MEAHTELPEERSLRNREGTGVKEARPELPEERSLRNREGTGVKEARPELPKKRWLIAVLRIIALIIGTGATVIAAQLFVGNILLALFGAEMLASPAWSAVYSALSYIVAIMVLVFGPVVVRRVTRNGAKERANYRRKEWKGLSEELGLVGLPTWTDIGLAPIGYIAYMVLGSGLLTIFTQMFPWFNMTQAQEVGFSYSVAGGEKLLALLTLVIVAPIAEEIIFRGWLYEKIKREMRGWTPKWAEILVATLLTSALFGFVHLQWNVGVNVFALSVILCLLREITGTTYAGILLHILKNGVAFYILFGLGL